MLETPLLIIKVEQPEEGERTNDATKLPPAVGSRGEVDGCCTASLAYLPCVHASMLLVQKKSHLRVSYSSLGLNCLQGGELRGN